MPGNAAPSPLTTPRRFTSICRSRSSGGVSRNEPACATPALFTNTSGSSTAAMNAANESRSRTSRTCAVAPICAAAAVAASSSTSPIATFAPAWAKARAVARPMPRAPPVIATVNAIVCLPASAADRDARRVARVAGGAFRVVADAALVVDVNVVHEDVDVRDVETEQRLDRADRLLAHLVGDRRDDEAVFQHDRDGEVGLLAFQLDGYALRLALLAEVQPLAYRGEHSYGVAAEVVNARYVARGDAGDLLDYLVRDRRRATGGRQRRVVADARDRGLRRVDDPVGGLVGGLRECVAGAVGHVVQLLVRLVGKRLARVVVPARRGGRRRLLLRGGRFGVR